MLRIRINNLPKSLVEPFKGDPDELETIRKLSGLTVLAEPVGRPGGQLFRPGYTIIDLSKCVKLMDGVPDSVMRKWTNRYTMYLIYFPLTYAILLDDISSVS
jgi:hypothetical protein